MNAVLAATAHKPLEFLEARQLVQMSEVDSALRDEARSDHLWLIQLQNYFPTTYGLSSLPSHLARNRCRATHGRDEESTELVPVRAHGERRDRWSFHPADEGAAVQGLVLSDCWTCEGRYYRRKNGNGAPPAQSVSTQRPRSRTCFIRGTSLLNLCLRGFLPWAGTAHLGGGGACTPSTPGAAGLVCHPLVTPVRPTPRQ